MRLALPTAPALHVFAPFGDRQPPQGPCSCGVPLGDGAVLVRTASGRSTWECEVCFAQLEAGWEAQRLRRVREFITGRSACA